MSFATKAKYIVGFLLVAASAIYALNGAWDPATYSAVLGLIMFNLADGEVRDNAPS